MVFWRVVSIALVAVCANSWFTLMPAILQTSFKLSTDRQANKPVVAVVLALEVHADLRSKAPTDHICDNTFKSCSHAEGIVCVEGSRSRHDCRVDLHIDALAAAHIRCAVCIRVSASPRFDSEEQSGVAVMRRCAVSAKQIEQRRSTFPSESAVEGQQGQLRT